MKTNRITLRPWQESDAETLFKYASDPDVGPRAGWPVHKSLEESLDVINYKLDTYEQKCEPVTLEIVRAWNEKNKKNKEK